jgi:hypothetical protein
VDKQKVSKQFYNLAEWIDTNLPTNPETIECLKHLRRAKDCAVTSEVFKED